MPVNAAYRVGDVCRVIGKVTVRKELPLTSQWMGELSPGNSIIVIQLGSQETGLGPEDLGLRRVKVRASFGYVQGWISTTMASGENLIEKHAPAELPLLDLFRRADTPTLDHANDQSPHHDDVRSAELWVQQGLQIASIIKSHPLLADCIHVTLSSSKFRGIWQGIAESISVTGDVGNGLAMAAAALVGMQESLYTLEAQSVRLIEEFLCLEDCDAEELFGTQGDSHNAIRKAKRCAMECNKAASSVHQPSPSWVVSLPNPLDVALSLQKGAAALNAHCNELQDLRQMRRILVARLKTLVEARAAAEAMSARTLLSQALDPSCRIDFPIVTEICERATSTKSDLSAVVHLLGSVLKDTSATMQRKLKALTVTHELLYDSSARQLLIAEPGLTESLSAVHSILTSSAGHSNGAPQIAAESACLLAAEIQRRLDVEANMTLKQKRRSGLGWMWPLNQTSQPAQDSWLALVAHTPSRQMPSDASAPRWSDIRSLAENLVVDLRRSSSSNPTAPHVLDRIFTCLDDSVKRLQSLCALDASSGARDDVRDLAEDLLPAAEKVQTEALQWKCQLVAVPDDTLICSGEKATTLAEFMEEAVNVGDRLNACLAVLLARSWPVDR